MVMKKNNILICFLFLFLGYNISASAETGERGNFFHTLGGDFSSAWSDAGHVFGNVPKNWDKLFAGAVLAGLETYATSLFDEHVRVDANHVKSFPALKQAGEIRTAGLLSAGIYLGGWLAASNKIRLAGVHLAEAYVLTAVMTLPSKFILGRARPYCNEGSASYHWFEITDKYQSMPSGHSAVAFTMASVLSKEIGNIYASIALYGIASCTAYQRMVSDHHWFSDTVLGATIGIFSGLTIENTVNSKLKDEKPLSVTPIIENNGFGISFSGSF